MQNGMPALARIDTGLIHGYICQLHGTETTWSPCDILPRLIDARGALDRANDS